MSMGFWAHQRRKQIGDSQIVKQIRSPRITLGTEHNFLWAVGSRMILYEWCNASSRCGRKVHRLQLSSRLAHLQWIERRDNGVSCSMARVQVNIDASYKIDPLLRTLGSSTPIRARGSGILQHRSLPILREITLQKSDSSRGLPGMRPIYRKYFMLI